MFALSLFALYCFVFASVAIATGQNGGLFLLFGMFAFIARMFVKMGQK